MTSPLSPNSPWKPISQEPPYETCLLVYCDHGYKVLTRVHSELDYEWWDGLQRVDVNVSYWMMIPMFTGGPEQKSM